MADSSLEEEVAGPSKRAGAGGRNGARSGSSRPSFTDYWKRTKEAAKHITFVSSSLEQSGGPSKDDQRNQRQQADGASSQSKSQARRAQVRKAQIQHRQRKANYTKELEMDVAKLRDLIEQAERDALLLRNENDAIRRRLISRNVLPPAMPSATAGPPGSSYSAMQVSAPEYTVSLLSSTNLMDTPVYQVQRASSSSSWSSQSGFSTAQVSPNSAGFTGGASSPASAATLSEANTDHAINFILGLEHICWDHFHPSHYDHQDFDPETSETGHTLMVSSIALRSASAATWEQIGTAKDRIQQRQQQSSASNPPQPSTTSSSFLPTLSFSNTNTNTNAPSTISSSSFSGPTLYPQSQPHTHTHSHNHPHSHNTPNPNALATWRTSPTSTDSTAGLTLESLYGLASTLNPPDRELAPVQAWFEIARIYGRAAVRDTVAMDRVCAELAPAVECLVFGAVIQRDAFESVVSRVLGPAPGAGQFIGVAA